MGSGRVPADGALDAELTALRARAYGVDADIGADPVALARLAELEARHASSTARGGYLADAADPEREADAERRPWGARSRRWRRSGVAAFVAGAAVALTVAGAAVGWTLWTSPRPAAMLAATDEAPSEQVLRLTDYARRHLVMTSTMRGFEPIFGLEVWSARSRLGNECLLIFDPVADELVGIGCAPPSAEPEAEIYNVPVAWAQEWTEQLPMGTLVRFQRVQDAVAVWIFEGSGEEPTSPPVAP